MAPRDLLLAIDNGTQSLKAMVFDLAGNMVAVERVPFEPYFSKKPGWAEQDPLLYWKSLCTACRRLWLQNPLEKERIAGMSITAQRATVVNLDRSGSPLRPAILWLDQRKTPGLRRIGGAWGLLFKASGLSATVARFQREAEANWIKTHQPEIWEKTYKYLLLSGYLTYLLTGRFADSVGCQVGYLPFDYKRHAWSGLSNWKWQVMPVKPEMLPELYPPGSVMGFVTARAASETGIPEGLPVVASAADKACETLGAGTLDSETGCISYGTTATINVVNSRYLEPVFLVPPYPSAVPGCYCLEVQIFRGFWMVSWFKKEFGLEEQIKAEASGIEPEELFEGLAGSTRPGAEGLVLQPYWSPGVIQPGPEARGAVIGFSDMHTRAHLYRSILEGLAYALQQGRECIEKKTKQHLKSLRVSGGGSQSSHAMQVTADIFNLPAARPHVYETSGLGAAINAAVGLGLMPDYRTAAGAMTRTAETFEPDERLHMLYRQLYCRVYKKMYKRLKPLYREIRRITGYPG